MSGLWKDLPHKIHQKVSENWISAALLLTPIIGTYTSVLLFLSLSLYRYICLFVLMMRIPLLFISSKIQVHDGFIPANSQGRVCNFHLLPIILSYPVVLLVFRILGWLCGFRRISFVCISILWTSTKVEMANCIVKAFHLPAVECGETHSLCSISRTPPNCILLCCDNGSTCSTARRGTKSLYSVVHI